MADKKISELTALTGANVADTDLLPIVDTSATETKKITFGEFKSALDTATGFVRITGDTMTGALTTTGLTVAGNLSVDGGTIKLDGNYPVGTNNVALGDAALDSNVSGASNVAIGADALTANTASNNTAVGYQAGYTNSTGASNTFLGYAAGYATITGNYNTLVGRAAGLALTEGSANTFVGGYDASTGGSGAEITTGSNNTILGAYNGNQGGLDIRTSDNNIVLSDGDGNPRVIVDSSGNVGIGVVAASIYGKNLHVHTAATTGSSLQLTDGTTGSGVNDGLQIICTNGLSYIWNREATGMVFATSNLERMRIDSSGSVGIGVVPETWNSLKALQINSQASVSADASSIQLGANCYYNSGWKYINGAAATNYYQDSGVHVWRTAASGSADTAISWSEAMRIDSSGNVGIGTSSPSKALDVVGAFISADNKTNNTDKQAVFLSHQYATTSEPEGFMIMETYAGAGDNRIDIGGGNSGYNSATAITFNTSSNTTTRTGTERMRVNSAGNVGIGTSSPSETLSTFGNVNIGNNDSSNPASYLRFGATQYGAADIRPSDEGGHKVGLNFYTDGTGDATINPTFAMRIDSSGNVGIGTSSPAAKLHATGTFGTTLTSGIRLDGLGATTNNLAPIAFYTQSSNWGTQHAANIAAAQADGADGGAYLRFSTSPDGNTAPTERMRIDSSGNVGIGRSPTAGYKLDIEANNQRSRLLGTTGYVVSEVTNNGGSISMGKESSTGGGFMSTTGAYDSVLVSQGAVNMVFGTNNTERMRIDSSGNLLVGKTSTDSNIEGAVVYGDSATGASAAFTSDGNRSIIANRLTNDGEIISVRKDGTTVGSIGSLNVGMYISAPNNGGAALVFNDNAAPIYPSKNTSGVVNVADNYVDLGAAGLRFKVIYAATGSINTSDRTEKQDIDVMSEAETRVAVACKGLMRKFRWKDAVAEKGDDARIHFGIIAQDLQDAFAAEGLDASRYAMFCSDTWWETQTDVPAVEAVVEVLDEEGNVVTEAVEAKEAYIRTDHYDTLEKAPEGATERTRLGVRYSELLAFIIGAL
jgi:hypothetical protein